MAEHQLKNSEIYHERQKLQLCLLHALNNLFQDKDAFTRSELDSIASQLILDDPTKEKWTPVSVISKPHHNLVTGNYDINVLAAALNKKGKTILWHDKRNGASSINLEDESNSLMGIVLNVPTRRLLGLLKNRHWITLRKIDGVWYNLDSDLRSPERFEGIGEVREFLDNVTGKGGEILLVIDDDR